MRTPTLAVLGLLTFASPVALAGDSDAPPPDADGSSLDFLSAKFKPGAGLELSSRSGDFKMIPRFRVQFRYELEDKGADAPAEGTMMLRRARLQFKGNIFGKHNRYKVEFAFSPKDLGFQDGRPTKTPILTWYAEFTQLRDLSVKVGQYKVPFNRQRVVSSGNLEIVDRSLANGEFNLDRDIGVEVMSKDLFGLDHRLRYHLGAYVGEGRDAFLMEDVSGGALGFMYLGRVVFNPMGKFDDMSEGDLARTPTPKLSLGAAYAFVDEAKKNRGIKGSTPTDGGTTDYHVVTADLMFKWQGLSVFADAYYRDGSRNFGDELVDASTGDDLREAVRRGAGWSAQLGYALAALPLAVAGRFSQVVPVGDETSMGEQAELGGAISYYFAGHPLKLQADYFRRWEGGAIARGEDVVRAQLQVAY